MSQTAIIYLGVGVYMTGMLGIGYYASRKITKPEDFLVAGRRLPLWLCTATLSATWFGGATVLGAAGTAFKKGFLGVIADPFGAALCLFVAGFFFVRIMRRMRLITLVDFFDSRYNKTAGFIAILCMMALYIGWTGALLVSIGFILHTLTGMSTGVAITIGTVIALLYTTAGGMWAVSLTDFFQIVIVLIGLAIVFPIVLMDAGGIQRVISELPEGSFRLYPKAASSADWLWYVRAWLVIGFGNIPAQDLLQRSLSAKNENVAQNSAYISGFIYLTFGLLPILIGMIGSILMPDIINPELIVPTLVMQYLPAAAVALFISALLAAVMSSADSAILASSSIIGKNVLRFFQPDAPDAKVLWWSRWAVPVIGILSLFTALYFKNIYNLFVNSYSIPLVSLFVPLTAGIWWPKANVPGALSAMLTGLVCWIGFKYLTPNLPSDIIGLAVGAVVMVVVSLATQKAHPPRPLQDANGLTLAYENRLGLLNPFERKPRLRVQRFIDYQG